MSDHQPQLPKRSFGPWPEILMVLAMAVLFAVLHSRRSDRQKADAAEVSGAVAFRTNLSGTVIRAQFKTPVVTDREWQQVSQRETVRHIDLSYPRLIEGGLAPLASLPRLMSLQLRGSTLIDGQFLKPLAELQSLEELSLTACPLINDAAVPPLIAIKPLKKVDLRGTPITAAGLSQLRHEREDLIILVNWTDFVPNPAKNPNRDRLTLGSPEDIDALLPLLMLPHNWDSGKRMDPPRRPTHTLTLSGPSALTAAGKLAPLMPMLATLTLINVDRSDDAQWTAEDGQRPWFPRVTRLELAGDDAGAILPLLAGSFPALSSLSVDDTRIPADIGHWSQALSTLELNDIAPDSDLSGIADVTSLQTFRCLRGLPRPQEGYEFLGEIPLLQHLDLSGAELIKEDIEAAMQLPSLEMLLLGDRTKMTDELVEPLLENELPESLHWIMLSNSSLSDEMIERITTDPPTRYFYIDPDIFVVNEPVVVHRRPGMKAMYQR